MDLSLLVLGANQRNERACAQPMHARSQDDSLDLHLVHTDSMPPRTLLSLALLCLGTRGLALRVPVSRDCRQSRRCPTPSAKLGGKPAWLSRKELEFTGSEPDHEFGLQGHVLGLAPNANSAVLLFVAVLVARSHSLPLADLAFAAGFPVYLVLANSLRFDNYEDKQRFKPLLREGRGPWFKRYILTFALAGLVLPLPLVLVAPPAIARAAAPHLFLTAVQCAVEALTAHSCFAALLRLAVPIGFNTYRLSTLQMWCAAAFASARASSGGAALWAWPALGLALANAALWTYNLFVFLLLRVAPQYIDAGRFPVAPATWKWALVPVVEAEAAAAGDAPEPTAAEVEAA